MTDQKLLKNKILLRPDEVAAILRISKSSVYRMVHQKKIRGVKIGGTVRIFTESVTKHMGFESEE